MTRKGKIITTIVSAILIAAGAVVCVVRWAVWFGNQPETAYEVEVQPHNIVLSFGEQAVSSRIFSWRADTMLQPSYVELIDSLSADTMCLPAQGTIVHSRAGKAACYRAIADSLPAGSYLYRCHTGTESSAQLSFVVSDNDSAMIMQEFLVFGDVQSRGSEAAPEMFTKAFERHGSNLTGMVFTGDIIERPTDMYWQVFFLAMNDKQAEIPVIAATGNHEYLKGVIKHLDSRWSYVFGNPHNGPQRFAGTVYFLDFPNCRYVILDTDALQILSDYTIMQTWLRKVLREREDVWKVVVMHHPVYSAGKGRDNPFIYATFESVLSEADLVFAGHDHNYMRRTGRTGKPVYIITNSSEKFYAPKDSVKADSHAAYVRCYEDVRIYTDSIRIYTWNVDADSIFDTIVIGR